MIPQLRGAPVGQVADGRDRRSPLGSPTMVSELKPATRWLIRLFLWTDLAVGAALLISAATTDDNHIDAYRQFDAPSRDARRRRRG
jgi:hypothetical protein